MPVVVTPTYTAPSTVAPGTVTNTVAAPSDRTVDPQEGMTEKQPGPLVFGRRVILHPHHW